MFDLENIDGFYPMKPSYISRMNIKSVRVKTSAKDEGLPIKDTYARRYFFYDSAGNLLTYRRKKGFSSDTLRIEYTYDSKGQLSVKKSGDIYGKYNIRYFFGQNRINRLLSERQSAGGTRNKELNMEYIQRSDTVVEVIAKTDKGKVDYREIIRKNTQGLLLYYARLYDYSNEELRIYYEYDSTNRLERKIIEEKTPTGYYTRKEVSFFYDSEGRLSSEKVLRNGEFHKRVECVYENDLLKAKIEKSGICGKIYIHEYNYEYGLNE